MKFYEEKEQLIELWKIKNIVKDERIIKAFKGVKREDFILKEYSDNAYEDYPLPIHCEQTISQPTTIVIMIEALEIKADDEILEIGAGSGYNAALMSRMCKKVYASEIIPELADFARKNLEKAGIKNAEVIKDDGSLDYKRKFDKIIVTCACPKIPEILIKQLKNGGILIIPVGGELVQSMYKIRKTKEGKLEVSDLGEFRFVPVQGKYGYA